MSIAITEEHQELARVARAFLADSGARAATRARLEAPEESLPPFQTRRTLSPKQRSRY